MPPPVLLAVGFGRPSTGFGRVVHAVLDQLKESYRIHHLAVGALDGAEASDWDVHHSAVPNDIFGSDALIDLATAVRPDIVLIVHDIWAGYQYYQLLGARGISAPAVHYAPIDGELVNLRAGINVGSLSRLVAYTQFGRMQMERLIDHLPPGSARPSIEVIPHGVDAATFFPLSRDSQGNPAPGRRLLARSRLFSHRSDLADAFIVLNANRNQQRKRIDLTLKSFAIFAQGKPDTVRLYLHMEPLAYYDIRRLADEFGILSRLLLPEDLGLTPPLDDGQLNLVYNACDVGLNTAGGEGWGLISVEHAITGAPQVVPDHSACTEIWRGAAELVRPESSLSMLAKWWFVAPGDVAVALDRLYRSERRRKAVGLAGYRVAIRPEYRWDRIGAQWRSLFARVLEETAGGEPKRLGMPAQ